MPILTVEVVGPERGSGHDRLAATVADRAAEIFRSQPGRLWVRVYHLPGNDYAENGVTQVPTYPVFVSVLLADPPGSAEVAQYAQALAEVVAEACGRPPERVHVLFEPSARGRIAFGGKLLGSQ